jgi:DNA-binding PadR family transcriptional regulator
LQTTRFYILLALSAEPMHGYELYDQIVSDSRQSLLVRPATIYRLLADLERCRYVERVTGSKQSHGPQRKMYGITEIGRRVLKLAASDLANAAEIARSRLP